MRQEDLRTWLDLPQTQKIRLQWEFELKAAQDKLNNLKVGDFPDVMAFALETARLQERIRLRFPLVNDPLTALNIYDARLKQIESQVEE